MFSSVSYGPHKKVAHIVTHHHVQLVVEVLVAQQLGGNFELRISVEEVLPRAVTYATDGLVTVIAW